MVHWLIIGGKRSLNLYNCCVQEKSSGWYIIVYVYIYYENTEDTGGGAKCKGTFQECRGYEWKAMLFFSPVTIYYSWLVTVSFITSTNFETKQNIRRPFIVLTQLCMCLFYHTFARDECLSNDNSVSRAPCNDNYMERCIHDSLWDR